MPKTILITNGTGLIGSYLTGELAARGHQVLVLSRSARFSIPDAIASADAERVELVTASSDDREILSELCARADVVFHQAISAGVTGAVENVREYVQNSMSGTATLLDVLKTSDHKVSRVILSSSISVYGEGNYLCALCGFVRPKLRYKLNLKTSPVMWDPSCPNCAANVTPVDTDEEQAKLGESIYAVTKKSQEDLLSGVCQSLQINLSIFRMCTLLGAGQSWHNPFTRFLELLADEKAPILHEDGLQTRDFIFAEDVIASNLSVLERDVQGVRAYNIGTGESTTLYEFARQLALKMSRSANRTYVSPLVDGHFVSGDVRHCKTNCKRMKDELGIASTTKLDDGLEKLVDWYLHRKSASFAS